MNNLYPVPDFPHCIRDDLKCSDSLNVPHVQDMREGCNYHLSIGVPQVRVDHPFRMQRKGSASMPFMLPWGHTHYHLSVEFRIQDWPAANPVTGSGPYYTGSLLAYLALDGGATIYPVQHWMYSSADYLAGQNLAALPYPALTRDVGGDYSRFSVTGALDSGLFPAVNNGLSVPAYLVLFMTYPNVPGPIIQFPAAANVIQDATHPDTGQSFGPAGVYQCSLNTGVL